MSQQELLDRITKEPGILQKQIIRRNTTGKADGHNCIMLLKLVRKGCVRRELSGRTYALFPTGETL